MSQMETIIALRIPFSLKKDPENKKEELEFIKSIIEREPDEAYSEEDWLYHSKKGQWEINKPNGQWFLDYPIFVDEDSFDIDNKISLPELLDISKLGKNALSSSSLVSKIDEEIIRTLSFSNSAASGLSDIQ